MIPLSIVCTVLAGVGLLPMPYGFYTLSRIAFCLGSAVAFVRARERKATLAIWTFGAMAVLYNPVLPIHLRNKMLWAVLNFVSLVILWVEAIKRRREASVGGADAP
jgi:hypothetical protein